MIELLRKQQYVAAVPSAAQFVSFGDFQILELELVELSVNVGFGAMGWVHPAESLGRNADEIYQHPRHQHSSRGPANRANPIRYDQPTMRVCIKTDIQFFVTRNLHEGRRQPHDYQ